MRAVLEHETPEARVLVTYDTHPDRYAIGGCPSTARSPRCPWTHEEKGIQPGYRLKLNSRPGVDIEATMRCSASSNNR
jgi:hypothetical protein